MSKATEKYKESDMQKAIHAVRTLSMSKKAAAKRFGIPRSTLLFRLSDKFVKVRKGPQTVLSTAEELALEEWLVTSQRKGFPKRKEDVLSAVKDFLDAEEREHPFGQENMPGNGWFKAVLKRHPGITLRTPDPVTSASSTVGASDIRSWFCQIENFLKDQGSNALSILEDGSRIFNGDETNFLLCPKTKTVLAAKGARNIYEIDIGLAKSNLTVMFSFSASGALVPPMVIYPYKRIPDDIRKSLPNGWGLGISDNGWMTKEVFYEYISKVFYPHLVSIGTKFPVIYFVDGHATHLTLPVSKLCVQLQIILIALYPNATRILQPADVSAFKPLKNGWNKKVLDWRRKNIGESLTRQKFAPLLNEVVISSISPQIIKNGFRTCGLFPWNVNAIDFSRCIGKSSQNQNSAEINEEHSAINNESITYANFCELVGPKKLQEFEAIYKNMGSIVHHSEDYNILYKMFLKFKPQSSPISTITGDKNITSCNVIAEIDINTIDEFICINNNDNSSNEMNEMEIASTDPIPIQIIPSLTSAIENYLDWPITPERQGCKPITQKRPFVITNPLWIQAEQTKKEVKIKESLLKEEKKNQRLQNKLLKKLNKKSLPKKITSKKPRKTSHKSPLTDVSFAESVNKMNSLGNDHITLNDTDEVSPTMRKTGHIRNLFEEGENIGENQIAVGAMCFECTLPIKNNEGLKCHDCIRELHISCIIRLGQEFIPIFRCTKCMN